MKTYRDPVGEFIIRHYKGGDVEIQDALVSNRFLRFTRDQLSWVRGILWSIGKAEIDSKNKEAGE